MSVVAKPLKTWVKEHSDLNYEHLATMALRHDLDGALDAGQLGLAWWAQQQMLLNSVVLFLADAGITVPWSEDRLDRAMQAMQLLEGLNPALADQVWQRWLAPIPPVDDLVHEIDRTMELITSGLKVPFASSRDETVIKWATSTKIVRTVAQQLGIAQRDDWYVSDPTVSEPELDWYGEVLKTLEKSQPK
ncbi:hypothetical protein [Catellatospora sichuanensis]|uniref:hypothetical protein n=1 Tax=Catellatospora sichuanensis TaxID=1969805 RepID=UPI0011823695|nr:hypothetical protein [Catellatospora sichuanensis]